MSRIHSLWSPKEVHSLIQLKNKYQVSGRIKWKKISQSLKYEHASRKTPKQCRDYFKSSLQFGQNVQENLVWSKQDHQLFFKLHYEHGPRWKFIASNFKNKSENNVKNMFRNTIRKITKQLNQYQINVLKKVKKEIVASVLNTIIDLSNQIMKKILDQGMTVNEQSEIFKFRKQFLKFCFCRQKNDEDAVKNIIQMKNKISLMLRSSSIFRVKNQKNFKLNNRFLRQIYLKDKIANQNVLQILQQKPQTKIKQHQYQIQEPEIQQKKYSLVKYNLSQLNNQQQEEGVIHKDECVLVSPPSIKSQYQQTSMLLQPIRSQLQKSTTPSYQFPIMNERDFWNYNTYLFNMNNFMRMNLMMANQYYFG